MHNKHLLRVPKILSSASFAFQGPSIYPLLQFNTDKATRQGANGEKSLLVKKLEFEVREYLGKGLQPDEKVDLVCYCSVGYRSSIVAEEILKLKEDGQPPPGLRPVNLEGSIFQWASEGRSLTRKGQTGVPVEIKVTTVHPFSTVWGALTLPFSLWQWE